MVTFRDVYDVSARQKKVIEEKAARRIELRNEYLRKYLNPYKPEGGMMVSWKFSLFYSKNLDMSFDKNLLLKSIVLPL